MYPIFERRWSDAADSKKPDKLSMPTTIVAGSNTANPFYQPIVDGVPVSNRSIEKDDFVIIETGIHDQDGTTDVMRTVHFGEPSFYQKVAYTRALMAIIEAGRLVVPENTTDHDIDIIIRRQLYDGGFDFPHITGHGMDPLIRAIKAPPEVRARRPEDFQATKLKEGMILVIEPGCYFLDKFGVRLGNVFRVIDDYHNVEVPKETRKRFLTLDSLTAIPFETKLINWQLLTTEQPKL